MAERMQYHGLTGLWEKRDWTYLRIRMKNGQYVHGGNQLWWSDGFENRGGLKKHSVWLTKKRDEKFRIAMMGCGVIAMNDLEWYLMLHGPQKESRQEISQEEYMLKLAENWEGKYRIEANEINLLVGLYPWKMEKGLTEFFRLHLGTEKKIKWAPFWKERKEIQAEHVWETLTDMLARDYPIVCAYHTFRPKKESLILYHDPQKALHRTPRDREPFVGSHYMTIVGIIQTENGERLLQLESWGRIYYVSYDFFAGHLSYFTNILMIN